MKWSLLIFFCALITSVMGTSKPCNYQSTSDGGVCICNETYCDTIDVPRPDCGEYVLVTSSENGKRFDARKSYLNETNSLDWSDRWLEIDDSRKYQKIIGFGGALTDAASHVLSTMKKSIREHVYESYLSPTMGAAYQIFRIPIGASDFSPYMWGYNEQPENDILLTNITELHPFDRKRADQIKEIETFMPDFKAKLLFCAWSPPPWMKNTPKWTGRNHLLDKYYFTYALYYVKVLNLWQKEGVDIWTLSTGNEPLSASFVTGIPNLGWNLSDQRRWVTDYLRPMLNQNGLKNVSILGMDDIRSIFPSFWYAFQQNATDHHLVDIDMVGVHWYYEDLALIHLLDLNIQRYQVPILYTEGCVGAIINPDDMIHGPVMGSWKRGQYYVERLMKNFAHGISGFIDWNMMLDAQGGPNFFENYADAPIILNETIQIIYKQPIFYGIAHFSKFLQPDCIRISANLSLVSRIKVKAIAFSCANHTKVIIMQNRNIVPERITVIDKNKSQIKIVLDASSVNTLVYRNC